MSLTLITACMHCAVVSVSFCSDSFSSSVASIFHQDWWWKLMVTEWKELETLSSHELASTDSRPESLRCAEEVSAQWSDSPIINTRSCWKMNATRQHGKKYSFQSTSCTCEWSSEWFCFAQALPCSECHPQVSERFHQHWNYPWHSLRSSAFHLLERQTAGKEIQQNKYFQKENESCTMKEHSIPFN